MLKTGVGVVLQVKAELLGAAPPPTVWIIVTGGCAEAVTVTAGPPPPPPDTETETETEV